MPRDMPTCILRNIIMLEANIISVGTVSSVEKKVHCFALCNMRKADGNLTKFTAWNEIDPSQ